MRRMEVRFQLDIQPEDSPAEADMQVVGSIPVGDTNGTNLGQGCSSLAMPAYLDMRQKPGSDKSSVVSEAGPQHDRAVGVQHR